MKFAVACLIGSVSAMGKFYSNEAIADMKAQWEDIVGTYMDNIDMITERDHKEKARLAKEFAPFAEHMSNWDEKYGEEMMAWFHSPAVQEKEQYERDVMWPSKL